MIVDAHSSPVVMHEHEAPGQYVVLCYVEDLDELNGKRVPYSVPRDLVPLGLFSLIVNPLDTSLSPAETYLWTFDIRFYMGPQTLPAGELRISLEPVEKGRMLALGISVLGLNNTSAGDIHQSRLFVPDTNPKPAREQGPEIWELLRGRRRRCCSI